MEPANLPPPVWVDKPAALQRMVADLTRQSILAVDTESNSLFAYREKVCLIQFSTSTTDYLVDPLALADLSPLGPIFADPAIEKVFHAAEYDLICLKRDFDFHFTNLFDTMLGARILGRQAVGLGALLKEEFDLDLDKHFQRANWGQRPLPAGMLAYARLDTHYLVPLRERLLDDLVTKNLWPLAAEDFARQCEVNGKAPNSEDDACWRINGAKDLDPRQMAVLLELCRYREERARAADLPVFKILDNQNLLEIALACPGTADELREATRVSDRQFVRHAQGLLEAVQRGLLAPIPKRPPSQPYDEQLAARMEALRTWRRDKGQLQGVESDVILPRDVMQAIAEANPHTQQELARLMEKLPWRYASYGREILECL
jgi:ribonuclease D